MNSKMQLLSFLVSFLYGIIFSFLTIFNFKIIENYKVYLKHILTFIYVLDMTFIYIIILYNLNKGYFHIYFILTVILGFLIGLYLKKKIFCKINVKHLFKHCQK